MQSKRLTKQERNQIKVARRFHKSSDIPEAAKYLTAAKRGANTRVEETVR